MKNKKILIAVALIVVLGAGGFIMAPKILGGDASAASAAAVAAAEAAKPPNPGSGLIVEMPERIVNLGPGGAQSYIKVKVSFEVKVHLAEGGGHGKGDPYALQRGEIAKVMPVIEDLVNASLSVRTSTDLSTSDGKEQLKHEILKHAESVLGHELPVTFVYFNQFVMQ